MNLPRKVMIIDDEIQIQRLLMTSFSVHGIKTYIASDGKTGISLFHQYLPEIILLDIGLPDISGLEVLTNLRKESSTPIIMLSAKDDEEVVVWSLENGADDYIRKPVPIKELFARMQICMRNKKTLIEQNIFYNGQLKIDWDARLVFINDREISLSSTEYELLRALAIQIGKVVTHQQLLKSIWGKNSTESTHYLRVYMGHLRNKIEINPDRPKMLVTETGIGYRMKLIEM